MCESFRGEERGKSAYAQTESDYPRECEEGEARGEADYAYLDPTPYLALKNTERAEKSVQIK